MSFACTKCKSRHPFDELSKGDQLCKQCRKTCPLVACTYCRLEFHITKESEGKPVCKRCAHSLKTYGQPSCCECCNIRAAFEGTKCSRCISSITKYGLPVSCEQCKLKCAFNRPDQSKEKVGGKTLCLLCTISYKRIAHKNKKATKRHVDSGRNGSRERHHHHHHHHHKKARRDSGGKSSDSKPASAMISSAYERLTGARDSPLMSSAFAFYGSGNSETPAEPMVSDHMAKLTELKEQVASLKKQLQQKEQILIEKEKKITELKAEHWEKEKDFRQKTVNLQKEQVEKLELLTVDNRSLRRQVATLTKSSSGSKSSQNQTQ